MEDKILTDAPDKHSEGESGNDGEKPGGVPGVIKRLGTILFFPVMLFYLEFVLHVYMREGLRYISIWLLFSLSMGFLLSLLILNFGFHVNRLITYIITITASCVFGAELVLKKILSTYYQLFSIMKTAAGNNLADYSDLVRKSLISNIPGIILLFVPVIFLYAIGRRLFDFNRRPIRFSGIAVAAFVLLHLGGLGVVNLPWSGDYTPAEMYATDQNVNDQVQQLGVVTMLRLDLKHTLFGVNVERDYDFVDVEYSSVTTGSDAETEAETEPVTEPETEAEEAEEELTGNAALFTNTDTSANIMDADLEGLAESSDSSDLEWLLRYFDSETPSYKNKYTGAFEGYNVIVISAEGFTGYGISEEYTPTLYKLSNEGFVFNNFYTALHYTSTAGGECQNLLGLYPKNGGEIITQESGNLGTNWYFSLAQQLNRLGYDSYGYHDNVDMYNRLASHTNIGYRWHQDGSGFEMERDENGNVIWQQSDLYMMEQSVDDYIDSGEPFNVYYMTVSGHMPYEESSQAMAGKNKDMVKDSGYSDITQGYLSTLIELDKAMEYLIGRLEDAGIADKTLVVLSADHIPYFNVSNIEELAGKSFTDGDASGIADSLDESAVTDYDLYKNTLIMWTASMDEPVVVDKVCCQVDILPTVSNLLGLEYDSRMLSGRDILSDSYGLVAFNSGSWLTDYGYYDRYTGLFTPADGVKMTEEEEETYVAAVKKEVSNRRSISEIALDEDAYEYIFPGTKNSSAVE